MPALVNSSVGSLPGTSELDGTTVWPCSPEEFEEGGAQLGAGHALRRGSQVVHGRVRRRARPRPGPGRSSDRSRGRGRPGSGPRKTRDTAGIVPVLHVRGTPAAADRPNFAAAPARASSGQSVPQSSSAVSVSVSAMPRSRSSRRMRTGPWPRPAWWATNCSTKRLSSSKRSAARRSTTASTSQPGSPRRGQPGRARGARNRGRPAARAPRCEPCARPPRRRPRSGFLGRLTLGRLGTGVFTPHAQQPLRGRRFSISCARLGVLLQEHRARCPCPGRCARPCSCTRSPTSRSGSAARRAR